MKGYRIDALGFEWLIGWRQVRAHRRNHFISFISLLSTIAIALGVASLIVVMAVIDGLQGELRDRILGVVAHAEVSQAPVNADAAERPPAAVTRMDDWQGVLDQMRAEPGVVAAAPFVAGQALLANEGAVRGSEIRGVLPEDEAGVSDLARHMLAGQLDALRAGQFGIVLGVDLAQALRVSPGDKLTLISPVGTVTPAGIVPRVKVFTVQGVFEAGMPEFDAGFGYIHLQDAQKLYRMGERVSGIRLRMSSLDRAPAIAQQIAARHRGLTLTDWTQTHTAFFRAMAIERMATFIMLSLIVAVAAFNVIAMLVMAVNEKRSDIAILRTMGASAGSIRLIFIVQGMSLGLIGTLGGALAGSITALKLGTIVSTIENLLGSRGFATEFYYLTAIPAQLHWADVVGVVLLSLVLCLLATIYPSSRAAATRPAETLRYA